MKMKMSVKQLVTMAVLAALSVVIISVIKFPIIPAAPYLEYEPGDVPMLISGFLFGPLSGMLVLVVGSVIQALTVSAQSGWIGLVMHLIASGALILTSSLIYKRHKNVKGAILGLALGCVAMTLVMIPMNLFFTVHFWGTPRDVVVAMILPVLVPFNLIKSVANSLITLLVYKSLSRWIGK